jgi:DNA helicase-2/ATP-dependent DNA helicase PcrA
MAFSEQLQVELDKLNAEQRLAVDSIDGTVLVVAGPGTGKTQLLSLRVVNILEQRDVSPANILCLTFTNAGAEAMQKRLTDFIGRDAYAVEISTFHSFGGGIRNKYPEFFEHGAFDKQISDLQKKQLIENYLKGLSVTDPLYQKPFAGNYGKLNAVVGLIGNFKRAGLTVDQLRAVFQQNQAFFDLVEQDARLLGALDFSLSTKDKCDRIDNVASIVDSLCTSAPRDLTRRVVQTSGIYTPYAVYLQELFAKTELYGTNENTGRLVTTGFASLKKALFSNVDGKFALKDRAINEELFSVVEIYEHCAKELKEKALYDYDDMILDTATAIEKHPELKQILQDQYQ